jgi:hypothetical protein
MPRAAPTAPLAVAPVADEAVDADDPAVGEEAGDPVLAPEPDDWLLLAFEGCATTLPGPRY